jgi:hypothetical protein
MKLYDFIMSTKCIGFPFPKVSRKRWKFQMLAVVGLVSSPVRLTGKEWSFWDNVVRRFT